jgi:hypothetical protein
MKVETFDGPPTPAGAVGRWAFLPEASAANNHLAAASAPPSPKKVPCSRGFLLGRGDAIPVLSKRKGQGGSSLPPTTMTTVSSSHVYRFNVTSGSLLPVTVGSLLASLGGIAVSTTSFAPWASAVKLHSITVWTGVNSTGTTVTVPTLSWGSGTSGQVPDEERVRPVPAGVSVTGALVFRPPRLSLARDWVTSAAASDVFFNMQVVEGSVVDVHVAFRLSNVVAAPSALTTTGLTQGKVYYGPLDGIASNTVLAIGLPQL